MWTAKNRGRYDRSMRWLRLSERIPALSTALWDG